MYDKADNIPRKLFIKNNTKQENSLSNKKQTKKHNKKDMAESKWAGEVFMTTTGLQVDHHVLHKLQDQQCVVCLATLQSSLVWCPTLQHQVSTSSREHGKIY